MGVAFAVQPMLPGTLVCPRAAITQALLSHGESRRARRRRLGWGLLFEKVGSGNKMVGFLTRSSWRLYALLGSRSEGCLWQGKGRICFVYMELRQGLLL
jgi:hypothetical protein